MPQHYLDDKLTDRIISAAFTVFNTLGSGFLEKVYENALVVELKSQGLQCEQQKPISVWYSGQIVGDFSADLLVEDQVILELKAVNRLAPIHDHQLINYLRATGRSIGLLINFGDQVTVRRKSIE